MLFKPFMKVLADTMVSLDLGEVLERGLRVLGRESDVEELGSLKQVS